MARIKHTSWSQDEVRYNTSKRIQGLPGPKTKRSRWGPGYRTLQLKYYYLGAKGIVQS